jgi:hypothetical protein
MAYEEDDKDYVFCLFCGTIYIGSPPVLERVTRMEALLTHPKDYIRPSRAKKVS